MTKRHTSAREASKAGATLRDPHASQIAKSLAASALRQTDPDAVTSPEMAEKAARALESRKTSEETKSLAGTVLAQTEHLSKKGR
ncbi:MAG: hypothetical protein ACMG6S_10480 [Byssovorax sp.]